jgi:hypothetical protein
MAQRRWADAAAAFRRMLALAPDHPMAPQVRRWLAACDAERARTGR